MGQTAQVHVAPDHQVYALDWELKPKQARQVVALCLEARLEICQLSLPQRHRRLSLLRTMPWKVLLQPVAQHSILLELRMLVMVRESSSSEVNVSVERIVRAPAVLAPRGSVRAWVRRRKPARLVVVLSQEIFLRLLRSPLHCYPVLLRRSQLLVRVPVAQLSTLRERKMSVMGKVFSSLGANV